MLQYPASVNPAAHWAENDNEAAVAFLTQVEAPRPHEPPSPNRPSKTTSSINTRQNIKRTNPVARKLATPLRNPESIHLDTRAGLESEGGRGAWAGNSMSFSQRNHASKKRPPLRRDNVRMHGGLITSRKQGVGPYISPAPRPKPPQTGQKPQKPSKPFKEPDSVQACVRVRLVRSFGRKRRNPHATHETCRLIFTFCAPRRYVLRTPRKG